jgi:hypothetical protein
MTKRIILRHIAFTGTEQETARLKFKDRPTFIYGASNTGKSYSLKAIDFMLGAASGSLPAITEGEKYDTAWLGLTLPSGKDVTLCRSTKGSDLELHEGLRESRNPAENPVILGAKHGADKTDTLSYLLLSELGLTGKRVAKNKSGMTDSLSFRDIAPLVLVKETPIQAEHSPVTSDQRADTKEQSVFRLMISGHDDAAIKAKLTAPAFKTTKLAKIEALDELISATDREIAHAAGALGENPDPAALEGRLEEARQLWEAAESSLHAHLERKHGLIREIEGLTERRDDIVTHLVRFDQLAAVYDSDIDRLDALEEAGFLLTLGKDRDCPLCGAPAAAQTKSHDTEMIDEIKTATIAEIAKIKRLRADLAATVADLRSELDAIGLKISAADRDLDAIQAQVGTLLPEAKQHEVTLADLIASRDAAKRLAHLVEQRVALVAKRAGYEAMKQSKKDFPTLNAPATALYDFGKLVGSVLEEWKFPGGTDVTFDADTYDIKINGKLRTLNGKGVRALTHAAFKVALLLYCQRNGLPHPGFLVLDTPLLAYRDPIKSKKGELSADEKTVAASPVRENFFRHLASLQKDAQFIVLDNIDPPTNIDKWADTVVFTGNKDELGRFGFFPV